MRDFRWDEEKNEWLKKNRRVSFEQVVRLIEGKEVLEIVEHPNQDRYPGQKIVTVRIEDYVYLVPYVQKSNEIFLKTIIPSRKATNKYARTKE